MFLYQYLHFIRFVTLFYLFQFDEEDHDGNVVLSGKKKMFSKELRCLMYGFGDDQNPYTESVELLEDLVIEFITDMVSLIFGLVFI